MKLPLFIATLTCICLSVGSAHARPRVSEGAARAQHVFSATWSPVHLALPVFELTGEFRVTDQVGMAAVIGVGQIKGEIRTPQDAQEHTFSAYEGGVQFRYYIVGTFDHGMQLGGEAMYLHIERDADDTVSASAAGLTVGPFVGYKIATRVGFTFDVQLGFQFVAARARAEDSDSGASAQASDSDTLPLFNLNVGWSF